MSPSEPLRGTLLALLVLALAACAMPTPRDKPDDREAAWQTQRDRLEGMQVWHAEGRLSVRMAGDGGNAGFDWWEHGDGRFMLRLAGAWGQGVARLSVDHGRARLDTGEGNVVEGADAARLLRELYGWDVPVNGLRRWLIGLPTAGADRASYSLDAFGRLARLRWDDWQIDYLRYRQVGDLDLPASLEAERADGEARIRIAVDRWRPPAGDQPASEDPGADGTDSRNGGVPLIGE